MRRRATGLAPQHGERHAVISDESPDRVQAADVSDADYGDAVLVCSSELLDLRSMAPAESSVGGIEPQQYRCAAMHDRAQVDRIAGGHVDHVEGWHIARDEIGPGPAGQVEWF